MSASLSSTGSVEKLGLRLTQYLGDAEENEDLESDDVITALSFDHSGEFLAVGDKAGRLVIFDRPMFAGASQLSDYHYSSEIQAYLTEKDMQE